MVRSVLLVALFLVTTLVGAQAGETIEATGPVLFGDGGGRIWKWEAGEKTWLTPEGLSLVLGGVGSDQLWGWGVQGDVARFFTLDLPKKDSDPSAPVVAAPVFDAQPYPAPDRADRVGDRLLLVYGAREGHPRYEVWKADQLVQARAWDDGRVVYALALGPEEGWMIAGRTGDGLPWLEVSGSSVPAPEGWRGRLTVTVWVAEPSDTSDSDAPLAPLVLPRAAGWGAPGRDLPRPLFWGPEGWTQPDSATAEPGTYPVLGVGGEGTLVLAGWQSDETGALRPWFWDGQTSQVPGGAADGQPQAFSFGGKTPPALVVAHQSAPWFTLEDGMASVALEGLGPDDRVVAVEAQDAPKSP